MAYETHIIIVLMSCPSKNNKFKSLTLAGVDMRKFGNENRRKLRGIHSTILLNKVL